MVLPFFHMKKASAAKNSEVTADALGRFCVWPFLSSSWVAFGRPCYLWSVLPGVPRHWRFPPASGDHPPRLLPPSGGWVYWLTPEAPQKWECRRGWRYFWPFQTRVGFGPATGPTLKTALCHIRALVGRIDKYQRSSRTLSMVTWLLEVESYVIVVAFTSPPLLVEDSTFFSIKLICTNGPFKGHVRSPSVGLSISDGP